MSLTNVLQVAIGLILVYYALGLIVNILTRIVKDVFDMRAETLETVLIDFLKTDGKTNQLLADFKDHALIQNLKPITDKALQLVNRGKEKRKVSEIPNGTFSLALLDVLASQARLTAFVRQATERLVAVVPDIDTQDALRKALGFDDEKLADGLRVAAGKLADGPVKDRLQELIDLLLGKPEAQLEIIRAGIEELPDSSTKDALLAMINFSKRDVEDFRKRVESWYDDMLKNVSLMFTKHVRAWVIGFSFVVVFAFGADSIQIVRDLWDQPARQAAIVDTLTPLVDEFGRGVDLETLGTLDPAERETAKEKIDRQIDDLTSIIDRLQSLEDVSITWKHAWGPFNTKNWEEDGLLKLIGLLVTSLATAQGSSFWYDMLKKLKPQATTGAPTTESAQPSA